MRPRLDVIRHVHDSQTLYTIYLRVGHPTARLDLIRIKTPEIELFLEKRAAYIRGVVQLPGAIVVEYLGEDTRVSVKEVLIEDRVIVGEGLGQSREPRRRDLLQGCLVRLVPDSAHVQNHAVLRVHVYQVHFDHGSATAGPDLKKPMRSANN